MCKKNKTLILCVNYYSEEDTIQFIESVLMQNLRRSVIFAVINNYYNYNNGNNKIVEKYGEKNNILFFYPNANLGYFGAANWGLSRYLDDNSMPDWIIVSNSDILIHDKYFFDKLYSAKYLNHTGVIAPSIISSLTKADQNPKITKRPSLLKIYFYKWVFKFYWIYIIYELLSYLKKYFFGSIRNIALTRLKNESSGKKKIIYAPHGAFIIFNRNYFEEGANIKHGAFLFGEELFVAEISRKLNINIIYDPSIQVTHKDHGTTKTIKDKKIVNYLHESNRYIAEEFFNI